MLPSIRRLHLRAGPSWPSACSADGAGPTRASEAAEGWNRWPRGEWRVKIIESPPWDLLGEVKITTLIVDLGRIFTSTEQVPSYRVVYTCFFVVQVVEQ